MKRRFYLIIAIALCLLTSCALQPTDQIHDKSNGDILESSKYYKIFNANEDKVCYQIFNSAGDIVLSETTDRPLNIEMIHDGIVDIGIGMGSGIAIHKYYSVKKDLLSEEYSYVLSNLDELVAYIDVPQSNSFENRKVVVQNAFDEKAYYKEYQFDFSNVDTPVVDASFSNDGSALKIVYLSGEDQTEKTAVLQLDYLAKD